MCSYQRTFLPRSVPWEVNSEEDQRADLPLTRELKDLGIDQESFSGLFSRPSFLLRKEVIQPHLPIRLPCYDFTPIICPTLDGFLLAVRSPASGVTNFRGVTGGVYKARERIHLGMLTRDY